MDLTQFECNYWKVGSSSLVVSTPESKPQWREARALRKRDCLRPSWADSIVYNLKQWALISTSRQTTSWYQVNDTISNFIHTTLDRTCAWRAGVTTQCYVTPLNSSILYPNCLIAYELVAAWWIKSTYFFFPFNNHFWRGHNRVAPDEVLPETPTTNKL